MPSVLLVEHERRRAHFLRRYLSRRGYDVFAVATEAAALFVLLNHAAKFDALVVDAVLPGGRGLRFAATAYAFGLDALVIYAHDPGDGGRRMLICGPGGLLHRGTILSVGPLLDDLRTRPRVGRFFSGTKKEWMR